MDIYGPNNYRGGLIWGGGEYVTKVSLAITLPSYSGTSLFWLKFKNEYNRGEGKKEASFQGVFVTKVSSFQGVGVERIPLYAHVQD